MPHIGEEKNAQASDIRVSEPTKEFGGRTKFDRAIALHDSRVKPRNFKVEYLTSSNFRTWKTKLMQVLREYEVEDVVLGRDERPVPEDPLNPTEEETEDIRVWKEMDFRARDLILERIKSPHVYLVTGKATAAEMWNSIQSHCDSLGPDSALLSMFTRKWDGRPESLNEYLTFIDDKANDLRSFQGDIEDFCKLVHTVAIIKALPPSWSPIVQILLSEPKLDLENVIRTLKRIDSHKQ